ncbi:MAG TPA: protein phosphatase 2C domain-containing protein [Streptosporangiaceae bacterium]|nr:protein phosphatase 2C domain-containing protein [Streptosporangiaceae bacterium]
MTLALRYAIRSDVGLLREGNEDAAYAGPRLLAVADGMGGHAAGEVASAAAISALARLDDDVPGNDLLDALADAVADANSTLHDMVLADSVLEGMGTTLTAMLWSGSRVALCHIGDSRAYLLRDGEFHQITHDHTLVQTLVDEGRISPDDVATHPQRSMLLRALDGRADVEPDLSLREARLGDRYLLCSDGLSGVVSEETLHRTLAKVEDLNQVVLQLVELAIRGGGPDNITCIVADVVDSATALLPPSEASVMVGAASNGSGGTPFRTDSPASRAHLLTRTAPQVAVAIAHDDPAPRRPAADDGGDRGGHRRPNRRRLPLVTSALIILVVLVVGGAYAGWRYTQSQYYVGEDAGKVVIFRGINQSVAGIKLYSVAQRFNIPVASLPGMDASTVRATITSNSGLTGARASVSSIQADYQRCQRAYAALRTWQAEPARTVRVKVGKKTVTKKEKPPQPTIPADCPAPASSASGTGGTS